jgi:hypothetical protein
MATLDIFKSDAFSLVSLTDRINKIPYAPGLLGQLGIFPERGVNTTSIEVEERNNSLRLIPTNPRGAPPFVQPRDRRALRLFKIPQLQKFDTIYADQVQNVRSFGQETEVETVQGLVDFLMTQMRLEHDVTLEHLRVGALQGIILDSDGTTVLYNLFTEFGVAQQTAAITFSVTTTDIRNQLVAVVRSIEVEMGGIPVSNYRAIASPEFFDALVGHTKVQDAFRYQQGLSLGQDLRYTGFSFGGITWTEYRGTVDGIQFIPSSTAWVFPQSLSLGSTYFGPADFIETVNTVGLPIYAKQFLDDELQRFVSIYTQSNPLPILLRPRAVVKLTMN